MSVFSITSNRYLLVIFQQVEKWLKIKKHILLLSYYSLLCPKIKI